MLEGAITPAISVISAIEGLDVASPVAHPKALSCQGHGQFDSLDLMKEQAFNIAQAKMHLSRLVQRVEGGERITISRNNRPVAIVSPARTSPEEVLSRIDAARERIREQWRSTNPQAW